MIAGRSEKIGYSGRKLIAHHARLHDNYLELKIGTPMRSYELPERVKITPDEPTRPSMAIEPSFDLLKEPRRISVYD